MQLIEAKIGDAHGEIIRETLNSKFQKILPYLGQPIENVLFVVTLIIFVIAHIICLLNLTLG